MECCLTQAAPFFSPLERLWDRFRHLFAAAERSAGQKAAADREAVHLFYHEGYTTAEIGKMLGQRESTVRSDLRRGRARLKEVLKEAYDFGEGV